MIEESDIDKYHEVLHHVHERESELILKHEKVVKRSIDWDTLGAAYLDENDLSKIKKFDEQKKKRIEYMTKVSFLALYTMYLKDINISFFFFLYRMERHMLEYY